MPSAAIVLSILEPILASALCRRSVRLRIVRPPGAADEPLARRIHERSLDGGLQASNASPTGNSIERSAKLVVVVSIGGSNLLGFEGAPSVGVDPLGLASEEFETGTMLSLRETGDGFDNHEIIQSGWLRRNLPNSYDGRYGSKLGGTIQRLRCAAGTTPPSHRSRPARSCTWSPT